MFEDVNKTFYFPELFLSMYCSVDIKPIVIWLREEKIQYRYKNDDVIFDNYDDIVMFKLKFADTITALIKYRKTNPEALASAYLAKKLRESIDQEIINELIKWK